MILIHNFAQKNETEGFIEKAKGKLTATPLYVPNKPQGPIIFWINAVKSFIFLLGWSLDNQKMGCVAETDFVIWYSEFDRILK